MTLGLYDAERRYRHRVWVNFAKTGLVVLLVVLAALFAYQMGVEQMKARDTDMREEMARLVQQKSALELQVSQAVTAAGKAEQKAADFEARYHRDVPTGELAKLTRLLSERLTTGIEANRLAYVINAVQNQRNCQPPESKRFVLATPIYKAPNRQVSFANGTITVTGDGLSARSASGSPEGWYDPTQPVNLKVTAPGGRESAVTGTLPLHHSVVVENLEYRFTFKPGSRSFVEAIAERCIFP